MREPLGIDLGPPRIGIRGLLNGQGPQWERLYPPLNYNKQTGREERIEGVLPTPKQLTFNNLLSGEEWG